MLAFQSRSAPTVSMSSHVSVCVSLCVCGGVVELRSVTCLFTRLCSKQNLAPLAGRLGLNSDLSTLDQVIKPLSPTCMVWLAPPPGLRGLVSPSPSGLVLSTLMLRLAARGAEPGGTGA